MTSILLSRLLLDLRALVHLEDSSASQTLSEIHFDGTVVEDGGTSRALEQGFAFGSVEDDEQDTVSAWDDHA